MKVHSVLIAIEHVENQASAKWQSWMQFSVRFASILGKAPETKILGKNVFQISLENGMSTANQIFALADGYELKYQILFFEEAPAWVLSKPDSGDVAK
jgi:hypothetical protein